MYTRGNPKVPPRVLASGQRPKPCGGNNHVSHRFKMWCISFVVQPGRSPGIKMCVCTPGISSKSNNIHKTALIVFRPCRCENVFKVWKLISPLIGDTLKVMIPLLGFWPLGRGQNPAGTIIMLVIDLRCGVYPLWFSQVGVLALKCAFALQGYPAKTIIFIKLH